MCFRYLELQSSARRNEIRLHYLPVGSENTRMETFPYRLADGTWHHLAVTVSGTQIQVRVDCHELYKHSIALPDTNFSIPQLTLWLGQRSNKTHFMFKVCFFTIRYMLNITESMCRKEV